MLDKVQATIHKYELLEKGDKILVAVSGGVDSITTLDILYRLRDKLDISLAAAHLDHQLRGEESKKDAQLVETIAKDLKIPIVSESKDVRSFIEQKGLSVEEGARVLRYQFLKSAYERLRADKIALGHNLNDQVETFLMRLIRGAGLTGLRGMLPKRDIFIRPLIECRREEIREYAGARGLDYREDSTNVSTKYLRNKIRWELLPLLKEEYNPAILDTLSRTENIAREIIDYLDKQAKKILAQSTIKEESETISLDRNMLLSQEQAVLRAVIRKAIQQVRGRLKDIEFVHIQDIITELERKKPRSELHLPNGLRFYRKGDEIKLTTKKSPSTQPEPFQFELAIGGKNSFPQIGWSFSLEKIELAEQEAAREIYKRPLQVIVDFNKIEGDLIVRNRRKGDRLSPLGMRGTKKVKDLLIDEKIDYERRDSIPLICDREGIIWIVGIRLSDDYKITSDTRWGLIITANHIK